MTVPAIPEQRTRCCGTYPAVPEKIIPQRTIPARARQPDKMFYQEEAFQVRLLLQHSMFFFFTMCSLATG
jgi:hypothetical protein